MDYKRISDNYKIDGKELCWNLLMQWKAILICALIFAIALSGSSYIKERKAVAAINAKNAAVTSAEDLLSAVSGDSRIKIEELYELNQAKNQAADYINNSAFMNIDAYDHNALELVWGIHFKNGADSMTTANKTILLTSYKNALMDESTLSQIADLWGLEYDVKDLKELIMFDRGQHAGDTVYFTFILPDGVDVDGTKEILVNKVNSLHNTVEETVCPHDMLMVYDKVGNVHDRAMADQQASNYNRLYNIQSQMQAIQATMNDQEKEIYANMLLLDKAMDEGKTFAELKGSSSASLIKLKPFLFHMIVAMAAYILLYTAYIYIRKRLFVVPDNDIMLNSIGEMKTPLRKKQGILQWLVNDKALRDMRYKNLGDDETAASRIMNKVAAEGAHRGHNKIALLSDAISDELGQALMPVFSDENISITNATKDEGINQYDTAVLLIDKAKTSANDVDSLAEQCIERQISLLGTIYIV